MKKLLGTMLLMLLSACAINPETGQTEFDIGAARQELHLIRMDIQGGMEILAADDPELKAKLNEAIVVADQASAALDLWIMGTGDKVDAIEALDLVMKTANELVPLVSDDSETQTRIRLALFAADIVVRRIEAYME